MRILYRGIDMGVIETHLFECESVYDDSGVDYLFTRATMVVRAIINGQSEVLTPNVKDGVRPFNGPPISYAYASGKRKDPKPPKSRNPRSPGDILLNGDDTNGNIGAPGAIIIGILNRPSDVAPQFRRAPTEPWLPPLRDRGLDIAEASKLREIVRVPNVAPLTHQTIRHRLLTPRGKLWVFSGLGQEIGVPAPGTDAPPGTGFLLLEAPLPGAVTDCKNGPLPKSLAIYAAVGDSNTFLVDWGCECYFNEGTLNSVASAGMLLSNRFRQSHSVDEDGYTTVSVDGSAVFRTDAVYKAEENPDAFRSALFMPIPQGFTRVIDHVTGRDDVTGVDYAYKDKQVPVNFVAGPYCQAARISAVHRQSITSRTDVFGGALSAYQNISSNLLNLKWLRARDGDGRGKPMRGMKV